MKVDVLWLGRSDNETWTLGDAFVLEDVTPRALYEFWRTTIAGSQSDAWLLWDRSLGSPSSELVAQLAANDVDVWHAGLALGLAGQPSVVDFIQPTWMHNCDGPSHVEISSWRVSLRACLIRTSTLRKLDGPDPAFKTIEGAGLELGHRYHQGGALVRYSPLLVDDVSKSFSSQVVPFSDELRFAIARFGRKWAVWSAMRSFLTGHAGIGDVSRAVAETRGLTRSMPKTLLDSGSKTLPVADCSVSVLIPTIQRYPYLHTLLGQLRKQSVRPEQIIVIDQTPLEERNLSYKDDFADLPLDVIEQNTPGQCSSRNAGLAIARGDFIMFIDDDDELDEHVIERHLINLIGLDCDVSSGSVEEPGSVPLPDRYRISRTADVFPTNNTMVRRRALQRSGLFDLAYNRGERADGDLGMRVYLSGARMWFDPKISLFHHHAPRGGLRVHNARVITYGSSRKKITHRHLVSPTEIYLMRRYFSARQVHEALLLRILGTLASKGSLVHRGVKLVFGVFALPHTLWKLRSSYRTASQMMKTYPQIPQLPNLPATSLKVL